MKITFKNQHVIAELKSATAFDAIDEFINHLSLIGTIPPDDKGPVASAVRQREQSMSTGIGFSVAIPHASTPAVHEIIVAFGRSRNGIEFDSLDRQPVRLVLLMIFPAREREKHLPILAQFARRLRNKDFRAALETAPDVDAMTNILNEKSLTPAWSH